MKVELLVGRVSAEGSQSPGDQIEVSDHEAYMLITTGQAEPTSAQSFSALKKRIEKEQAAESEKQAKLIAIQKEQELKTEADLLLNDLLKIVDTVSSINPDYRAEFLESLHEKLTKDEAVNEDEENSNIEGEGE